MTVENYHYGSKLNSITLNDEVMHFYSKVMYETSKSISEFIISFPLN